MQLLQNHPFSQQNPVKKLSFFKAYSNLPLGQNFLVSVAGLLFLFFTVVLIATATSALHPDANTISNQTLVDSTFLYMLIGCLVLGLFVFFSIRKEQYLEIKEQQKYYRLGLVKKLNTQQRQALRLNLVDSYYCGHWSETLERLPCKARLQDKTFKPLTFDLNDTKVYQQDLNENWGVLNKTQYTKIVEQLFEGMHSKGFAYYIQSESKKNMIEQLAGLTRKPESYILDCNKERNKKPKKLIWGFDLWRIIPISRDAFMAGYITEEEAWKNILKASDIIYYLFDNHNDFYDNYRLGNAYWSNDLNITMDRLERWKEFDEKCDWPLRKLPWSTPENIELPNHMITGFAAYTIKENDRNETNTIGFRRNKD